MNELETKITKWLDEQGYPLEMRVARAFHQAGFRVLQSDFYEDPKTQVQREIDVVASISRKFDKHPLRLEFVVECKSSKDKPWIMFCANNQRLAAPARVVQRIASEIGRSLLFDLCQREDIQSLDLFEVTNPPAYGVTQAFTKGLDVTYAALAGAAAAAVAKTEEANNYPSFLTPLTNIVFPVVVTEGKLFTAVLQDDSSISLSEVRQGKLLWRNQVAGDPHTVVNLVADTKIETFTRRMFAAAVKIFSLCEGEAIAAAKNWSASRPQSTIGR